MIGDIILYLVGFLHRNFLCLHDYKWDNDICELYQVCAKCKKRNKLWV